MQKTVNFNHRLVLSNPLIGPLSGATTLGQSGPGSDGNEGVLRIPQSSSIAGTSPSDYLVSYPGHSFFLGGRGLTPLQRSSLCILLPQPTGQCTFGGSLLSSFVGPYHTPFLWSIHAIARFFRQVLHSLRNVDPCRISPLHLWIHCSILSVPRETISGLLASRKSLLLFVLLVSSTS